MSNPPPVSKEKLTAYQRWELSSFDEQQQAVRMPTAQELEALQKQAYQEAYQSGIKEARERSSADLTQLKTILQNMQETEHLLNDALANDVLDLALAIAQQMLKTSIQVRSDFLLELIRDALNNIPPLKTAPKLLLNAEDAVIVKNLLENEPDLHQVIVVSQETLPRGSVKILSESGELDATTGTRWKKILSALGQPGEWLL